MIEADPSRTEGMPEAVWAGVAVSAFAGTGGRGIGFFLDEKVLGILYLLFAAALVWWAYTRAMSSGEEKYRRLLKSAAFFVISFALVALWQNQWIYLLVMCGAFAYHWTFRDFSTPAVPRTRKTS